VAVGGIITTYILFVGVAGILMGGIGLIDFFTLGIVYALLLGGASALVIRSRRREAGEAGP
jgi:hypothetical protein